MSPMKVWRGEKKLLISEDDVLQHALATVHEAEADALLGKDQEAHVQMQRQIARHVVNIT